MSRLIDISLEESVLQSQWTSLLQLHRQKVERTPKIIELAKLTEIKLAILQFLAIRGESSAKEISETIHVSRSAVSKQIKELVVEKYVTYREVSAGVGAVKARQLYSLANDCSNEAIDDAIEFKYSKDLKLLNSVAENLLESVLSGTNLGEDITEERDLFFFHLKHLALEFHPTIQSILKLIPDTGIRSTEIASKLGLDNTTVNKHLKHLMELGWLCREVGSTNGQGRSGYVYFPVNGINAELINFLLNDNDQNSNGKLSEPQNGNHYHDDASVIPSSNSVKSSDTQLTSLGELISGKHFNENLEDSNANISMKSETSQQKSSASSPLDKDLPMAGEIMAKIKELLVLRRKVSTIQQELCELGGKEAEELIAELESEKF
ncbi:bifunctional ligase/repressor BirA [Nostoc carneum NIES-2107]|nr:bifunctional ligase/repressor BirA [Nostoc carneum NIES-2107]